MNHKKGFAISSMIYTILLLFLILLLGILGILGTRKVILDRMKNEITLELTGNHIYLKLEYENALVTNTSLVSNFSFTPLDIASVVDKNGIKISGASLSYESKPEFDSTKNGLYEITYTGKYQEKTVSKTTTIEITTPVYYEYVYSGRPQSFETPSKGLYQIELWGAQGGSSILDGGTRDLTAANCSAKGQCYGGKGSYTSGNITLENNTKLYIQVGGMGATGLIKQVAPGGYNGGGRGDHDHNDDEGTGGGGGATDVRLEDGAWDKASGLSSRIMVAAGGAGGNDTTVSGYGGSLSSLKVGSSEAATQTTGNAFGKGQNGTLLRTNYPLAGGGGGYYGGYSTDNGINYNNPASGGSSYISGHLGSVAIKSATDQTPKKGCTDGTTNINCSYHYSEMIFHDTVMKDGSEEMPTYDHLGTQIGNSQDGHATITTLITNGVVKANNIIANSGFESGKLDEWLYSSTQYDYLFDNSTSVTGKYSLKMTTKKVHTDNQQAYQIFDAQPNHIYYATAYTNAVVADTAKTLTRISFSPGTSWDWLKYSTSTSTYIGEWKKHSIWYQNPSYTTLKLRITIGANSDGTTIGDYYKMDNAMVLDLTEIYGAGNEPSKDWCDANITYFDGTSYIKAYTR